MKFSKDWSKNDETRYTWLYNYIVRLYPDKDIDEFEYIDTYKRKLMSIIENETKWSDGSKESLLFMVAKYLRNFGNKKYSKLYSEKGFEYMQKNRSKENENKQDEKESENYRDHQYFLNILDSINYNEIQTQIKHFQYLLLSLLVLQAPLRTDYYCSSMFSRTIKDNDHIHNFIRIDRRGRGVKCYYIINNDKVSKTKTYNMNKDLSTIQIKNKELCKLINDSFIKYPRKYLFEINDKPITQPTYISWLRKVTKVDNITNDIMRSSYVNWFYKNNQSLGKREELANEMRHSTITAQRNYLKIDDNNNDDDLSEEDKKIETKKINELQTEIYKLKENCEKEAPTGNYTKKRRDVIYTLNKGSLPRESTLLKYNIKYNNELKKYE